MFHYVTFFLYRMRSGLLKAFAPDRTFTGGHTSLRAALEISFRPHRTEVKHSKTHSYASTKLSHINHDQLVQRLLPIPGLRPAV